MSSEKGFTLIELLIVIGILAVLAVTAVLVLNPAEYFKKSRDATRLSDLSTTHRAIAFYQTDGGTSFGASNTVYVSIPDTSATCANLGLPSLPDGWAYACSSTVNYRKADSNGWIPVNLTALSYGAVLNILPIDPINTASTGNYYTYVTGGSWELTSLFESEKYADKAINDGDAYPGIYSIRTSQTSLTPGIRDKGLVGYWKFDETDWVNNCSTLTIPDYSGYGNSGKSCPAGTGPTSGVSGKIGNAFDSSPGYMSVLNSESINLNNTITLSFWVKDDGTSTSYTALFSKKTSLLGYMIQRLSTTQTIYIRIDTSAGTNQTSGRISSVLDENWHYIVFVLDDGNENGYKDGVGVFSTTYNSGSGFAESLAAFNMGGSSFLGFFDDVRIYNRALSASEIFAIYNATK